MLRLNRSRREIVGITAIAILAIVAVAVSILLTRESVRSVAPQITVADELERVPGGSVAIDSIQINGKEIGAHGFTGIVPLGATIDVSGWAVDAHEGNVAAGIVLFLDSGVVRASYGTLRPDVAKAFHNPELAKSGFHIRVETDVLKPGRHQFAWGVVAHSGIRVYVSKIATFQVR